MRAKMVGERECPLCSAKISETDRFCPDCLYRAKEVMLGRPWEASDASKTRRAVAATIALEYLDWCYPRGKGSREEELEPETLVMIAVTASNDLFMARHRIAELEAENHDLHEALVGQVPSGGSTGCPPELANLLLTSDPK